MNARISCISRRQSCLGGFAPSPSPDPTKSSSDGGDDDGDDFSCIENDDEMTVS